MQATCMFDLQNPLLPGDKQVFCHLVLEEILLHISMV